MKDGDEVLKPVHTEFKDQTDDLALYKIRKLDLDIYQEHVTNLFDVISATKTTKEKKEACDKI